MTTTVASSIAHLLLLTHTDRTHFTVPRKGGSLSQSRHCSKGVQPVPYDVYGSGCHDKQLPVVRFEPLTSNTALRHATSRRLRQCNADIDTVLCKCQV